jgi:hypothetical protein
VIPTMLLLGLVVGRRWAIPLGAVGWAVTVLMAGTIGVADVPVAAALGAANVAVGVLVRWAIARTLWISAAPAADGP